MGMQTAPVQLFYDFCLDDHVPEDHLLRRIDRFLDLEKRTGIEAELAVAGRCGRRSATCCLASRCSRCSRITARAGLGRMRLGAYAASKKDFRPVF